jgi:hypothetical protein
VEQRILSLPPCGEENILDLGYVDDPLDWLHDMNEFWSDMANAARQAG